MRYWKKMASVIGVILWIGVLNPEVFVKSGTGCIFDEDGNEIDAYEACDFMEKYFYRGEQINVNYRFALLDYWEEITKSD